MNSFVPIIASKAKFHCIDSNNYLIQQEEFGYNIQISLETYNILQLVDGVKTIEKINSEYEQKFNTRVSIKSTYNLLHDTLPQYGIIYLENYTVEEKKREMHLYLSFLIFNSHFIDKIVKSLSFLFPPKYFISILIVLAIFTYTSIITNLNVYAQHVDDIFATKFLLSYFVLYFVFLWHEFGHAAAGRKFFCKTKGIGFGFYWILPVFFSDMSDVWRLKRNERIIVNLGGIYFDLLNSTIFLIFFFITQKFIFLVLPTIIALSTLRNLNFFMKFDGYWIVSDLIRVPNLHKSSFNKLSCFLKKIKNKTPIQYNVKDYFLVSYSIISLLYIIFFLAFIIILNPNSLLQFPENFLQFLKMTMSNPSTIDASLVKSLIIPSLFFVIILNKLIKFSIKKLKHLIFKNTAST